MRKYVIIVSIALLMGVIIGILLPVGSCGKCMNEGVTGMCLCRWGDWLLRFLQMIGTLSAVVVALLKEWIYKKIIHPVIVLTSDEDQLKEDFEGDNLTSYSSRLNVTNKGTERAINCQVIVTEIKFTATNNQVTTIPVNDSPLEWGEQRTEIDIPDKMTKSVAWLKVVPERVTEVGDDRFTVPLTLLIGNKQIPNECMNGSYAVKLRVLCQDYPSQEISFHFRWNGIWSNHLTQMRNHLGFF